MVWSPGLTGPGVGGSGLYVPCLVKGGLWPASDVRVKECSDRKERNAPPVVRLPE